MQCTQCGHINQSARFCVKCGASLEAAQAVKNNDFYPTQSTEPTQPAQPAQPTSFTQPTQPAQPFPPYQPSQPAYSAGPAQPNPQLQQVKQVSKQYFSHFIHVLKSPAQNAQATTAGHMVNGLITLALFSLILPLILYFQARSTFGSFGDVSFSDVVIKPAFFMLIVVFLVNSVIFLVLKIGNAGVNYREVTARFGTFMVPSVACYVLALLFALISSGYVMMSLLIGLGMFSWFVAVCFAIYSFKKEHANGLDAFYAVVITYVVSIILLALLGGDILSGMFNGFEDSVFDY